MTKTITTGKMPGHPEACIAQYNHYIFNHSNSHNPNHLNTNHHNPNHLNTNHHNPGHFLPMYNIHPQIAALGHYWAPYWRPPVGSFPAYY